MSTRLTPEREAEIRQFAAVIGTMIKPISQRAQMTLDLLAEIDALREENRELRTKAGMGAMQPKLPPLPAALRGTGEG